MTLLRNLALASLAATLTGCGFHLRGSGESSQLPFHAIYVEGSGPVCEPLKRQVRLSPGTRLTDAPQQAEAIIAVNNDRSEKVIRSISASGKVLEYELRQRVSYSLRGPGGAPLLPAAEIQSKRYLTYSDAELYGKGAEEELLIRDMHNDLAQQIVRRIAMFRPNTQQQSSKLPGD